MRNTTMSGDTCDQQCHTGQKCCFNGCKWKCKNIKKTTISTTVLPTENSTKTIEIEVRKLEEILDTQNVTEVFIKRDTFADAFNDILALPLEDIKSESGSAQAVLTTMVEFTTKLGEHLRNTSVSSINIQRREVAIDVSVQDKGDVTVLVAQSSQLVSVDVDKTDMEVDVESITNFQGAAFILNSSFSSDTNNVLYATVYRQPKLFVESATPVIASVVISVSINNHVSRSLLSPIKLLFKKQSDVEGTISCVYWKFATDNSTNGYWDGIGCKKTKETAAGIVHCECNHMTNFALLLDVSQKGLNYMYMKVITWVGCTFSLIGLFFTILVYAVVKKVKDRLGSKIVVRLCISLTLLIIIFLAFAENRSGDENDIGCMIVSSVIHYFLLVTFMWMATEALSMYLLFVKPMVAFDQSKFLMRGTVTSLLLPAVIVIVTGASKPSNLASNKLCIVRGMSFYIGVLVPIVVILFFNMAIIVRSLIALTKPSMVGRKMSTWHQCKITLIMSILLGVTWLFTVFGVGVTTEAFQVIFCIVTSLQGFFHICFIYIIEAGDDGYC